MRAWLLCFKACLKGQNVLRFGHIYDKFHALMITYKIFMLLCCIILYSYGTERTVFFILWSKGNSIVSRNEIFKTLMSATSMRLRLDTKQPVAGETLQHLKSGEKRKGGGGVFLGEWWGTTGFHALTSVAVGPKGGPSRQGGCYPVCWHHPWKADR